MLPVENAYGVIVVFKDNNKILLLQHKNKKGSWSFPKGHSEQGESKLETALRELKEESGISEIEILDTPIINEEYEVSRKGEIHLKKNEYFIGYVTSLYVKIQESEINTYKWVSFEEAIDIFLSFQKTRIDVLKQAKKYLENE